MTILLLVSSLTGYMAYGYAVALLLIQVYYIGYLRYPTTSYMTNRYL